LADVREEGSMAALRHRGGALALVALGPAMAMPGASAMAKTFDLTISGDAGARYSGTCTVTTGAGDQTVTLDGKVPGERTFEADGLSCELQADGRIVVEVVYDGSRARSATSGGEIRISVR
jgi:hypothetical protein